MYALRRGRLRSSSAGPPPALELGLVARRALGLVGVADAVDQRALDRAGRATARRASTASAVTTVASSVIRTRTLRGAGAQRLPLGRPVVDDPVAGAADGHQRVATERRVDLLAQVARRTPRRRSGRRRSSCAPHLLEERRLRDDLAGSAHEVLEQGELARRELDRAAPSRWHLVVAGIEVQVADLQHGGRGRGAAAQHGAQAGHQHHEARTASRGSRRRRCRAPRPRPTRRPWR